MKQCKTPKVNKAPTIKPKWYTRLIPTRKTIEKWLKRALKAFKIEISLEGAFKWIFFILVWITIFPKSIPYLKDVMDLVTPFLN